MFLLAPCSRRALERRRRQEQELAEEEADRKREQERAEAEERARQKKEAAEAKARAEAAVAAEQPTPTEAAPTVAPVAVEAGARRPARARPLAPFADDKEEEDAPQARKLIPIQYTDEELRGVYGQEASAAEPALPRAAAAAAAAPDAFKKRLMAGIPKDHAAVLAYPIKWSQLDTAGPDVKARISGWVSKKIKDLMGEEEPSFCEFIMTQVDAREDATAMLDKLRDVLDDDADAFVMKLFQVLIYETEKLAAAGES